MVYLKNYMLYFWATNNSLGPPGSTDPVARWPRGPEGLSRTLLKYTHIYRYLHDYQLIA